MAETTVDTTIETTIIGASPYPGQRRSPWKFVGVVVALWAVVMGVGLLIAHDSSSHPTVGEFQPSHHPDPSQLDFVIGELPAGWNAKKAVGAASQLPPEVLADQPWNATASYGTHDDPTAPRLWLTHGDTVVAPDFAYLDMLEAVDRQTFTVDNRRAECGRIDRFAKVDVGPVQVWCYVDSVQQMVFASLEGFDVPQAVAVMKTLTFDASEPRIDVSLLPAGSSLLRHARMGVEDVWRTSSSEYYGPNRIGATLTVAWDDEFEFGDMGGRAKEFQKVDVHGAVGYLSASTATDNQVLVWKADGKVFVLDTLSTADLVAMARSVRPAP